MGIDMACALNQEELYVPKVRSSSTSLEPITHFCLLVKNIILGLLGIIHHLTYSVIKILYL